MRFRSILQSLAVLACAFGAVSVAGADEAAPKPTTPFSLPSVEVGAPALLRGAALPKTIAPHLAARTSLVEACQQAALDRGEPIEGRLTLRLFVARMDPKSADGFVSDVAVTASDEVSSSLRACIADAYRHLVVGPVDLAPIDLSLGISLDRGSTDPDVKRPSNACGLEPDGAIDASLGAAVKQRAHDAGLCFQKGAAIGEAGALPSGSMKVRVRIADDGSVCGAAVVESTFDRASLDACVLEAFSRDFSARPSGGAVDVLVPLVFKTAQ